MSIWVVLAAHAQEPEPVAFNADRVLLTTFQPLDEASRADAERLFALLLARFEQTNDVVPMAEVPAFDVQGYDAVTYMLGCPPGKYPGCVLVLGQRTDALRAVGCTVGHVEDEFDEDSLVLTAHVVDVTEAREVASFSVPVLAGREDALVDGIARVYDQVVRGEYELRDLRGHQSEQAGASTELDAARKEILAQSLAELEEELGAAVVEGVVGVLEPPRLTREDLAEFAGTDDRPPWERVGLTEGQYLRYSNSGQPLDAWRRDGWGRFARILVRASAGGGPGPWSQRYEGAVLLSDQTLEPVDSAQILEVRNASSLVGDLEVGFGVLPVLHVVFAADAHTGTTTYYYDENVENQVAVPGKDAEYGMSSWRLGGRAELAPFPRWPARPTLGVGLQSWTGSGITGSDRLPRLEAPNATFLEILPGAEVDATPLVALSLRVDLALPVGGTLVREFRQGDELMEDPPRPTEDPGMGVTVLGGLLFRVGPLFRPPERTASTFDDEP